MRRVRGRAARAGAAGCGMRFGQSLRARCRLVLLCLRAWASRSGVSLEVVSRGCIVRVREGRAGKRNAHLERKL